MKRILLIVAFLNLSAALNAQTVKTAVLVIGNGSSAWAAGVQSAVSGVKTIILTQNSAFAITDMSLNLHSGIESEFLKRSRKAMNITDSTKVVMPDQQTANEVIKAWGDTTKNLTVIRNVTYIKLSRSGSSWVLKLSDGKTLKAKILVHAGNSDLDEGINLPKTTMTSPKWLSYENEEYRTSIASGYYLSDRSNSASFATLSTILPKEQENLVLANVMGGSMLIGQAAGATAAYAAFFDTKTSAVKLKIIQDELLKYKLSLVPYADVTSSVVNWRAMQASGLMGILKAQLKADKALFLPNEPVTIAEVKAPLESLYYKAQIWFDDNSKSILDLKTAIAMVCYIGNKSPENVTAEVKKKWNKDWKFPEPVDLNHRLNRAEFSVLVNDYLQPLTVGVDGTGRIIR